jgi:mono/diheme cytochrome c family protein/plastocyanin
MTDTPGRPPEERLPAPRSEPSVPAPADRFSSPPSTRKFELTPERAAGIVRQSANARWVGFLVVTVVALFVIGYYFYELGLPGGLSGSHLTAEEDAQQVTSVERGYNIYEANCSRCHGVSGEGGIGPTLNRQDKLFAHLNPDYLHNVLTVGGRYVCGDPKSVMPVWSDTGNPPGPLNYQQIEALIAFLRATSDKTYEVRDPALNEPVENPDGSVKTFKGWNDPNYKPAPGATPFPDCWKTEFAAPSAGASGSASPGASGSASAAPSGSASAAPSGSATAGGVAITASGIAFTTSSVTAPAATPFTIHFDNQDAGTPHNVDIKDAGGTSVFKGAIFNGAGAQDYQVPALPAGDYTFVCDVHPNMTGTLKAG